MLAAITDQINNLKYLPTQKNSPNTLDPTNVLKTSKRAPPLGGGQSTKVGGMWNLKHDISSPKFYELLIKTEIKGDTDIDLNNVYNHIKMCLNEFTRIREDLLPGCQSINIHNS